LTLVNVLILGLVIGGSGLGTAAAQTISNVFVTNTNNNPVPTQEVNRAFQYSATIDVSPGQLSNLVSFTVPSGQCLVVETVPYDAAVPNDSALSGVEVDTIGGGVSGSYIVSPGSGTYANRYGLQQMRVYADQNSTGYIDTQLTNSSSIGSIVRVSLAGTLHPCLGSGPTVRGVANFTVRTHGAQTLFHWRMGITSGVAGFDLYAGKQRLTAQPHRRSRGATLPVHRHLRGTSALLSPRPDEPWR